LLGSDREKLLTSLTSVTATRDIEAAVGRLHGKSLRRKVFAGGLVIF
jgi:hypothetical protein